MSASGHASAVGIPPDEEESPQLGRELADVFAFSTRDGGPVDGGQLIDLLVSYERNQRFAACGCPENGPRCKSKCVSRILREGDPTFLELLLTMRTERKRPGAPAPKPCPDDAAPVTKSRFAPAAEDEAVAAAAAAATASRSGNLERKRNLALDGRELGRFQVPRGKAIELLERSNDLDAMCRACAMQNMGYRYGSACRIFTVFECCCAYLGPEYEFTKEIVEGMCLDKKKDAATLKLRTKIAADNLAFKQLESSSSEAAMKRRESRRKAVAKAEREKKAGGGRGGEEGAAAGAPR